MSCAAHNLKRYCDVQAALDARRTARALNAQGFTRYAEIARSLVHRHLVRAAAAKAGGVA
jgi:hypothetical protein